MAAMTRPKKDNVEESDKRWARATHETANPRILTINGGSSSIKFALFEAGDALRRVLWGRGLSGLGCRRPASG